jgi:hypothetical protein
VHAIVILSEAKDLSGVPSLAFIEEPSAAACSENEFSSAGGVGAPT